MHNMECYFSRTSANDYEFSHNFVLWLIDNYKQQKSSYLPTCILNINQRLVLPMQSVFVSFLVHKEKERIFLHINVTVYITHT